jgi:hypothetical protein
VEQPCQNKRRKNKRKKVTRLPLVIPLVESDLPHQQVSKSAAFPPRRYEKKGRKRNVLA